MTGKHNRRAVLAVVNLKGGTSKTTSAVFLAHALHEQGRAVLLVDADPQGSAFSWNEAAASMDGHGFPFPVVSMPSRELHKQLPDVMGDRFDAVIIDTPPLEQQSGIVLSSLRVATMAVVPVAPTAIEVERLYRVKETLQDAADLSVSGMPVTAGILFTRVIPNASSTEAFRAQLTADGFWVLRAAVGRLERFGQAYMENVTGALNTAYGDAVGELLAAEVVA
jgi:chromosome partitioning protein